MNVRTGFGYYIDSNSHVISKYILPPGDHPDPVGLTPVEVANQAALDAIQIYVPTPTPEEAFNVIEFSNDLLNAFSADMEVFKFYAVFKDLAVVKDFSAMKLILNELYTFAEINQDDYNAFIGVLAKQGIDLTKY